MLLRFILAHVCPSNLLLQIFSSKEEGDGEKKESKSKGDQAKELLAKYGGAYLATSITLSLISFSLCYALISVGVDVPALLQKVNFLCYSTSQDYYHVNLHLCN